MKKLILALITLHSTLAIAQQNLDTVKIRPIKITENIYMLKGAGGNIGVSIGKDGTLIIDDQFAPLSNKINGALKTIDPGELHFVINTHIHGDHSGGNDNFRKMGATIVAHDKVRERMINAKEPRAKEALPSITFSDKLNFHWNDEDIELIHLGNGHTDGDVIVHFIKANVYHMGDSFVRYGYPFIDVSSGGSFTGFISNLDKAMAMMDDQAKVIPGHGDLATKADIKVLRDKLVTMRDEIAANLKKGKKVEEIPGMGILDKFDPEMGKGFVKGKDYALIIATDLAKDMPAKPSKK